jgi:multiple sugar transport system ATP-binding protein
VVAGVGAGVNAHEPEILLDGVSKRFPVGGRGAAPPAALDHITLAVERAEIVVVVGPSGCGKSTALRIIAGLEEPDAGSVSIAGRAMKGVPAQDRDVAMVFQGYALYPQMTAREIIEFPLKMRGVARTERARAVHEAAALLRIEALLDRRPAELSGGERQRVAMGRAVVRRPRVFLFDEPLSNLDASLRADLRLEIGLLVRRLEATAVYVTHDHVEAMTLADRIAVMRAGKLLQLATPREVYERPATAFVGAFLGSPRMNLLSAHVDRDAVVAGPFRFRRPDAALPPRLRVGVRPEHIAVEGARDLAPHDLVGAPAGQRAEVIAVEPLGAETHLVVRVEGLELRARGSGFDTHRRGDAVRVAIDPGHVVLFDADGEGERVA